MQVQDHPIAEALIILFAVILAAGLILCIVITAAAS